MAFAVFGLADAVWLLLASRIVQGAGGGTTGVAQAYVADTVEPEDRARALGWLSSATAAGVILGPAIGSFAFHLGPAAPGIVAADALPRERDRRLEVATRIPAPASAAARPGSRSGIPPGW